MSPLALPGFAQIIQHVWRRLMSRITSRLILCFPFSSSASPSLSKHFTYKRRMVLVARKGLHDSIAFCTKASNRRMGEIDALNFEIFRLTVLWMKKFWKYCLRNRNALCDIFKSVRSSNASMASLDLTSQPSKRGFPNSTFNHAL